MIIDTQLLQEKSKKILEAIKNKNGILVETLELETYNGSLYLNITDKEYFLTVKIPLDVEEDFHAVVNAQLFLNLIAKITTKSITMEVKSNYLLVKGNGTYKLPLIFEGDSLVELARINIDNVTSTFSIKNSILQSILKYNDKILYTSGCQFPCFYLDNVGAVTISKCACLNTFTLEQPVSLMLSETMVRLFKLFKSEDIAFTMGMDPRADGEMQQKVSFADDTVMLTAIIKIDTKLVNSFPVTGIRKRAEQLAPYSAVISKDMFIEAIERLSLFKHSKDILDNILIMDFSITGIKLSDYREENTEDVEYVDNVTSLVDGYKAKFNVNDLLLLLECCDDQYLTITFGDKALSILKDNIKLMMPECR